ncbi:MAG: SusD/RagB family nutrient-binding outer membrane lipoprotein, partial [Daejeonella sp.]|uniref:SusD/RagB family nutrient-binding outer membrane lipoprotein n=1 Tax=Daejeonella sp. TaxID=2805397 RepID=UPI0027358000
NDVLYKGDITKWKRFGNSLLLRIAMRYTKVDANKARQFVILAVDPARGGVMQSNADNALVAYNAVITNANTNTFHGSERANFYLAKPFVDYLKTTQDPRLRVMAVKYAIPANPLATAGAENTNPADQEGMPVGYNENTIATAPAFPGKIGAAWRYSQVNRRTVGKVDAPGFLITHSQTQLLLAEAAQRGFITGNVKTFYDAGVKAHMTQMTQYDASAVISTADQDAYLTLNPFNPASALQQINTQYWISSFLVGSEAWANFRRSGFPVLQPNTYPNADPVVAGGFIRRLHYPAREYSVNPANVAVAVSRQGADNMATRIFWDK